MISPQFMILGVFVAFLGASVAFPQIHRDDTKYACMNGAIITEKVDTATFQQEHCDNALCAHPGDAVLTHVQAEKCDVYANVCSKLLTNIVIDGETYVNAGAEKCAPVKSTVQTFVCPSGDELIWVINEDMTSTFAPGKFVSKAPFAYYDSSKNENGCYKADSLGGSSHSSDTLNIMCDSSSKVVCK